MKNGYKIKNKILIKNKNPLIFFHHIKKLIIKQMSTTNKKMLSDNFKKTNIYLLLFSNLKIILSYKKYKIKTKIYHNSMKKKPKLIFEMNQNIRNSWNKKNYY